jgi:quercetin dioxygenase-like cupin family protein
MAKARYSKLQREPVLERRLPNANPPVRLIKAARIRFAPGQPSGLHRHPISTCGVITEGTFIFQIDGEAEQHLKTGDGFFEPACATIRRFDNASENEPAEIVCLLGGLCGDAGHRNARRWRGCSARKVAKSAQRLTSRFWRGRCRISERGPVCLAPAGGFAGPLSLFTKHPPPRRYVKRRCAVLFRC